MVNKSIESVYRPREEKKENLSYKEEKKKKDNSLFKVEEDPKDLDKKDNTFQDTDKLE
ncbi:MAG: hypothetical protein GXP45_05975 [bacterium]|nr:hypothetical protein [bacterium]